MNEPHITVNTGLTEFTMLDSIDMTGPDIISGSRYFENAPVTICIESMAQLAAYHTRYLNNFNRHAFLLKVQCCSIPALQTINGAVKITGRITGRSDNTFQYRMRLTCHDEISMNSELIISTAVYNENLPENILKKYYRDVFLCLLKDGKQN